MSHRVCVWLWVCRYEVRRSWVNEWLSLAVPPVHRSVGDLEFEWESLSSSIASALYDCTAYSKGVWHACTDAHGMVAGMTRKPTTVHCMTASTCTTPHTSYLSW